MVMPITQAMYAFAQTMTSSPGPIPSSRKAIHSESSPLASPTQQRAPR